MAKPVAPDPLAAHHAPIMRGIVLLASLAMLSGCSLFRAPLDPYLGSPEVPVSPGENFVVLSGGACLGKCPDYEIFVFESGRAVFNGRAHTARLGVVERHTMPSVYFDLRKLLTVRGALSRRMRIGCRTDHAKFVVAAVKGDRTRTGSLDAGCFNQADDLEAVVAAFVRAADAATLIGP